MTNTLWGMDVVETCVPYSWPPTTLTGDDFSVEVGWKKAIDGQTRTWHQFMKSLVVGQSHVNRCRLSICGPRDIRNQWLGTSNDLSQRRL